jgi:CHAT domain-containing protein/TPR repeat protein
VKGISLTILIIFSFLRANYVLAQNEDSYDLFLKFAKLYNSGDLVNAGKCMLLVLESKKSISEEYLVAAYNNLGATSTLLGKYKEALEYYDLAENQITENKLIPLSLADIYINKSRIYTFEKSFTTAIEYLEKGIRIYLDINYPDNNLYLRIATAYLNIGIAFYEIKDYQTALRYFEKSAELKSRYNLSKIALTYLNIAKTYSKIDNPKKAEEFFLKSIESFNSEFGEDYFRIAELFFDYGLFLESAGRDSEALVIFNKALSISISSYGNKHPHVSLAYKYLGDHFLHQSDYNSALVYYQKALISVVNDFNDPDIFSTPSILSALYDIRLLDILKSKSQALKQLALKQDGLEIKLKYMKKSLETIELAMQLISKIRNDYISEESRIYLADNEKETYFFATHISLNMYSLTEDKDYQQKMYDITKKAKAAVLRNEITDNELLYSAGISDTLRQRHNKLQVNIAAYNNLIQEEIKKTNPDNKKIDFWKDALFEMKQGNDKLENEINKQFPQYRDLLKKAEPISLEEIKNNLKNDETLIEYFLSNQYTDGKRKLYIFLVTKDKLNFLETDLDSLFIKDVKTIREGTVQVQSSDVPLDNYRVYTCALFNMYIKLIKPVENTFTGSNLTIIPDEEIAYLPFDAFLEGCPDSTQINYEGLQYLIYHYTFSYGYSSSLIFNKMNNIIKGETVYSFSPYYQINGDNSGKSSDYLDGATKEIGSIYREFPGKEYLGEEATETNFKSVIQHPAILHLAMHSMPDPDNSKYSCLLFNTRNDTLEDGKLYNYEIGLSRIKSPMVVLSACNTGTGTLSHGEGVMSLARGFILAGALSVVKTFWEVNDEASAAIIIRFYYHLSKGRTKDEAMRLAKLEYLKSMPPVYTNPYYWAAYEVLGDKSPVVRNNRTTTLLICVILILLTGFLIIYFRRRRILSARFW